VDSCFAGVYYYFFLISELELRQPIAKKFCIVIGSVFNFVIMVKIFGDSPPKNFRG